MEITNLSGHLWKPWSSETTARFLFVFVWFLLFSSLPQQEGYGGITNRTQATHIHSTCRWIRFIQPGGPWMSFFRLPSRFLSGITTWVSVALTWLSHSQGELGCHGPGRGTPASPVAPRESLYSRHVSTGEVFLLHVPYRF